jgi:hypothetical protein
VTLLEPAALAWLAAGLPVLALFMLRRRPRVVEVPAVMFWEAVRRTQRLARFGRRLRRWLSLALHLLVVAALAVALARPGRTLHEDGLIIVLDDSATLQTRADDATRFDQARARTLARLATLTATAPVTIVLAGAPPRLLAVNETDHARLRGLLADLTPRDVNPQLDEALLAGRRLAAGGVRDALVLTDRAADGALPPDVTWQIVGTPRANAGIVGLSVSPTGTALDVTIEQSALAGTDATITVRADGRGVAHAVQPLTAARHVVSLPLELPPGTPLTVRLAPDDALMLDNTACGVWPAPPAQRVALVSAGDPFLHAVLDQPGMTLTLHTPADPPAPGAADIVVIDGAAGPLTLPPVGRLLVFGGPDPLGLAGTTAPVEDVRVTQWAPDAAVLHDVDLTVWRVQRTAGLVPPPGAAVLAEAGAVPLVFTVQRDAVPGADDELAAVYVNFALADSDLARHAGFPVLVWNALDWLAGRGRSDAGLSQYTGAPLAAPPPAATATHRALDPTGAPVAAYVLDRRWVVPFPQRAGFYRFESDGTPLTVAVNWMPDGVPTGAVDDAPPTAPVATGVRLSWLVDLDWRRLVLLAGLVALLEGALFSAGRLRLD